MGPVKFALLSYSTNNLGDEIQSIAARQFLPRIDLLIDRDTWTTNRPHRDDKHAIILNGWFTRDPLNWPPPPWLLPCPISLHITRERFKPAALVPPSEVLMQGRNLEYLQRHQPIGVRDLSTKGLLEEHGVESYFSGCVALTLGAPKQHERRDYVCAVDISDELYRVLTGRAQSPIFRLQHRDATGGIFAERCARASARLDLYAHAKSVVTTRLHCALPCLAFGTPVLFINDIPDEYRLSGLIELMRHCRPQAFIDGTMDFDVATPTPNGIAHLPLRDGLISRLEAFTGASMRPYRPMLPEAVNDCSKIPANL